MKPTGVEFDPLMADGPVGLTKSLEAPGGAFSHDGRAYVFVNISPERWSEHKRPGDPAYGTYLISKDARRSRGRTRSSTYSARESAPVRATRAPS
jgi:hypothetical protein